MSTMDILDALHDIDEAPWADLFGEGLKPRKLAQLLGEYGIESHTVRVGHLTPKGYRREDLWDPWLRYVSPEKGNKGNNDDESVADVADVADPRGTESPEDRENISGSKIFCPGCGEPIPADLNEHWVCGWSA